MKDYANPTTSYDSPIDHKHKTTVWERVWDWIIIATSVAIVLFLTLLRNAN